jgi:hypothetical protein
MWSTYFDPTEGSVGKINSVRIASLYMRNNGKIIYLKKHIQAMNASQLIYIFFGRKIKKAFLQESVPKTQV